MKPDLSRVRCAYCNRRAHTTEWEGDSLVGVCSDHVAKAQRAHSTHVDALREQAIRFHRAGGPVERRAIDRWALRHASATEWERVKLSALAKKSLMLDRIEDAEMLVQQGWTP